MYWVHTSMYSVQTCMYQYILVCTTMCWWCTSMYLIQYVPVCTWFRGQNLALAGPCRAQPYSCCPCSGQCCDYLWLCGMGVSAVQGCDECKMLSLQLTIEETAEKQDAASKSSDKLRKESCEGCKEIVWTAQFSSWWVCTCTSLVHTGMYWSVQNVAVGKLREDILVLWTVTVANEAGCVEWVYGATQANKCCLIT